MFLVFDTETSGLPLDYNLPAEYVDNWPHIVQLSWGLYNDDGSLIIIKDYIVKPVGFKINPGATKTHGLTTEDAFRKGHNLKDVMLEFKKDWKKANYICAHNMNFDINVVGAEFCRLGMKLGNRRARKICTMVTTTEFCEMSFENSKYKSKYNSKYKWPKLQELYFKLFNTEFSNAHDAKYDVIACAKCLFHCIENGIISIN